MSHSSSTDIEAWLALSQVPGLGPCTLRALMTDWQSPIAILQASDSVLQAAGFNTSQIKAIKQPNWQWIATQCEWQVKAANRYILTITDPQYPSLLLEIADSPVILFVAGDITILTKPQLAMVGSRQPSPQGIELAYYFAEQLAKTGLVITSGLALGIDGASHKGALQARGQTIAVLGSGLQRIYPTRHQRLAADIVDNAGVLLSEFPLYAPPLAAHFPQRNRIISGLSLGVLVVEAALQSGSLITARLAAEYGREVFALPGAIRHPLAKGCHALIQQGAKLVTELSDILNELTALNAYCIHNRQEKEIEIPQRSLDQLQQKLLQCVDFAVTSVDQIIIRSNCEAASVMSVLSTLELIGNIARVPGGYIRVK